MRDATRWGRLLAALWLGALLAVALIATPSAFALLPRADAGRVAARILAQEAYLSLVLGALLLLLLRTSARVASKSGQGSGLSASLLLALGTLFCTVAGYFGVLPAMSDARAGIGRLTFGQLHAISSVFFAIKVVLVAALAWRLSRSPSS